MKDQDCIFYLPDTYSGIDDSYLFDQEQVLYRVNTDFLFTYGS